MYISPTLRETAHILKLRSINTIELRTRNIELSDALK